MAFIKLGFLFVVVTLVHANLQSPCPSIFQYNAEKKTPGKWEGVLNLDSEFELSGLYVRVIFDKKAEQISNDHADVKTEDHLSWIMRMPNMTLTPGEPVKIPFSVKYNEKDGEPTLVSVRLNARDVCPHKKEAVNISPCPGVFKYTFPNKGVEGKWYGELSLDSEFPLNGVWIRVYLDKKGQILPNGFGEVEPRDSGSYLIRSREHVLKPGNTLKVPFIVSYEDPKSIPNISRVKLNARTVCESKLIPTTVRLTAEDVHDHVEHDHGKPVNVIKENAHNHHHH